MRHTNNFCKNAILAKNCYPIISEMTSCHGRIVLLGCFSLINKEAVQNRWTMNGATYNSVAKTVLQTLKTS